MFEIFKSLHDRYIGILDYIQVFDKAIKAERKKDYKLAKKLYEVVIDKGFYEHKAYAFNNLAIIFKYGLSVDRNIERSKKLLNEGLHYHNPCTILNIKYFNDDNKSYLSPADNEEALNELIILAKNGDVDLQYELFRMYGSKTHIERNDEKSQYWFNLSAKNGHTIALNTIKADNKIAKEKEQDEKAIKDSKKGDPKALYDLAVMCIHFRYYESYEGEFLDLIEESANKEYSKSQYFLGLLYESGIYLEKNKRGKKLSRILGPYPQSVKEEYIPSLKTLFISSMSDYMKNYDKNIEEAIYWYKKSANHNYLPAIERLNLLNINYNEDKLKVLDSNCIHILEKLNIKLIYHMTHLKNLRNILEHGLLSHNNSYKVIDISNEEVNSRRDRLEPIYNNTVHYYVPFYFNPRNAMLYRNQKFFNNNIIIIGYKNELLLKDNVVYTNANAAADETYYSNNINDLINTNFIDFNKVFSSGWNNYGNLDNKLKQTMMAEVLIPSKVENNMIDTIFCINNEVKHYILKNFDIKNINVIVDTNKFF